MQYCKTYYAPGQNFSSANYTDGYVTDITLPPGCGDILVPFIHLTVRNVGGKIYGQLAYADDGTIYLNTIKFPNGTIRQQCLEKIEQKINETLQSIQSFSVVPSTDEQETKVHIQGNMRLLFMEFQKFMKEIGPVIQFIENNGGWFNEETHQFPGMDALELVLQNETFTAEQKNEIESALTAFADFMLKYSYGNQNITIQSPMIITPHK